MNRIHNEFCNIEDLTVEDDYLIFMHENQSVVSWGIPLSSLKEENPAVWQRNNKSRQWYPEGESFTAVMESMFAWYSKMGLWNTA